MKGNYDDEDEAENAIEYRFCHGYSRDGRKGRIEYRFYTETVLFPKMERNHGHTEETTRNTHTGRTESHLKPAQSESAYRPSKPLYDAADVGRRASCLRSPSPGDEGNRLDERQGEHPERKRREGSDALDQ